MVLAVAALGMTHSALAASESRFEIMEDSAESNADLEAKVKIGLTPIAAQLKQKFGGREGLLRA
jgi:hypothetical protein